MIEFLLVFRTEKETSKGAAGLSFGSLIFLCAFFPLVLLGYFTIPQKGKNAFFIFASLFFYSWGNSGYLMLLISSILITYGTGLLLHRFREHAKKRRAAMLLGVVISTSLLVYFKYYAFLLDNINAWFGWQIPNPDIGMPLGISFFTFKSLSYILDVYFQRAQPNKNLLQVALYVSLFPHLISGPIVQYNEMCGQLAARKVDTELFCSGIQRFVLGLSKKVLLADILGLKADTIFSSVVYGIDTPTAWLGLVAYTLQIYLDFSGYSDMAIGLGRMFGFTCGENFRYPYISTSITEFWRRWHISLSTWFRDYLYIPMGGNRRGNVYLHLLVVFLVTGIWHGASWNFVLWGLWHGLFLVIEKILMKKNKFDSISVWFRWPAAMLIVMLGWVLFRTATLEAAGQYLGYLFGAVTAPMVEFGFRYYLDMRLLWVLAISAFASVPLAARWAERHRDSRWFRYAAAPALLCLMVVCMVFVINSDYSPFIYFQF